jgi:putative heme degradation protein
MPDTRILLEQIGSLGYAITVTAQCVEAVHEQTGELHRVRFYDGDRHKAACLLAQMVGIDLADG